MKKILLSAHYSTLSYMSQQHVDEALDQTQLPGAEPSVSVQCQREGGGQCGLLQYSDLPPCRWLPLFAHSVNYYQKAVYPGCSPTLLHILWPFIKGDLHYKLWSPSKKARAPVCASGPIPASQRYLSTPSCFGPPIPPSSSHSLSFC